MPRLVTQPTAMPTRKIRSAALGGALATLVVWVLQVSVAGEGGAPLAIPPGIEAALATVFAVLAGYVTREEDTPGDPGT